MTDFQRVICGIVWFGFYFLGYWRGVSATKDKEVLVVPKGVGITGVMTTGGPNKEAYVMLNNGEVILVAKESK